MNKIYFLSFSILFLQSSLADINTANNALVRGDHVAAAAEFQKLAEQGDKKAQAHLGYMYYVGEGVRQDYVKAVKWYKKAAILGDKDSQYNLAVAYAFGEGIEQDYKEAFHWYRRAAEQNHAVAQYSIGVSYAYGEGIPQDPKLAAEWFQKSAERGYERAQILLGSLYHTGNGVKKDYEKAALWYRKAADKGNVAAQYNLGTLYRAGHGVEQNYNQAVRWFRLSADQGYAAAQNELASIERAIAGANRPAPISASKIGAVPEQVETSQITTPKIETTPTKNIEETITSIPSLSKIEPTTTETIPTEPAITEAAAVTLEETPVVELAAEEKPKKGFFSKLFGKKDKPNIEPEQSGEVYASPEEVALVENSVITAVESVEDTAITETTPTEPAITEAAAVTVGETPVVELAAEEKPKKGFFSKLFGKKDKHDDNLQIPETIVDESSGVIVYAAESAPTGQQLETSPKNGMVEKQQGESDGLVTQFPLELPVKEISSDNVTSIESNLASKTEDQMPKKGFFSRLLGKKSKTNTEFIEADNIITSETTIADPEALSVTEAPTEEKPKKGFFSRLFDKNNIKKESDIAGTIEFDQSDEALVIAKLEEAERNEIRQRESEEAFIDSIKIAPGSDEDISNASELQPLAIQGNSEAQSQLGSLYYQGKGVKRDYAQAFLWYRRAAQQNNTEAQYNLGNMYLMGEGIKQDDYQARQWYEKAAKQGHKGAQHNLKSLQRIATAEPVATASYDPDENLLPDEDEENVNKEAKDERGFFSKLFGKDDDEIDNSSVESDISDEGVHKIEAIEVRTSFNNSENSTVSADSIYEKGLAYEFGEGVIQSYSTAFEYFKKSAEQNHAPAQYKLGLAYTYGQGTEQNLVTATEWYQKSAKQGYALAQRTLGTLYMGSDGIEQNKPLALAWYDILADSGNVMDVHRRNSLKEKLTSEEIEEANKLKQGLSN